MVLGRLAEIFGWDLDAPIEIGGICLFNAEMKKEEVHEQTINLNFGEMDPEERREVLEALPQHFEEAGRLLRDDESDEVQALESGYGAEEDDVVDYFDRLVSDQYLEIIERGLWLRVLIQERDLEKEEIEEYKGDLADKYGGHAWYLANLVTGGYFDPNGGVRDLLRTLRLQEDREVYEFHSEIEKVVNDQLICVFVESDDSVREVVQEIRGRLSRHKKVEPLNSWLDVQGIGEECRGTIEAAMQQLEDEYFSIDYDWRNDIGEGATVRIHVETVPQLN